MTALRSSFSTERYFLYHFAVSLSDAGRRSESVRSVSLQKPGGNISLRDTMSFGVGAIVGCGGCSLRAAVLQERCVVENQNLFVIIPQPQMVGEIIGPRNFDSGKELEVTRVK